MGPLREDLLGRGDDLQMLVEVCHVHQPLHLLGATDERKLLSALGRALVPQEDHAQTGRVDELQLRAGRARAPSHAGRSPRRRGPELCERRHAGQVEFAVEPEHHGAVILAAHVQCPADLAASTHGADLSDGWPGADFQPWVSRAAACAARGVPAYPRARIRSWSLIARCRSASIAMSSRRLPRPRASAARSIRASMRSQRRGPRGLRARARA